MLSAKQIEDIQVQAYKGYPSRLGNICKVYPLKLSEIIEMGESVYNRKVSTLLLTENEVVENIKEKTGEEIPTEKVNVFQYLLLSAEQNDMFFLELQETFSTFIKEEILFLPKINSILVGNPEERRLMTEESFIDFQNILRIQNKKEFAAPPPKDETYGERKMRLLREKVAAVKKKQAQQSGEGQTLLDLLEIADVFGIDTNNCTVLSFYNLIHRNQAKEKWEHDIQLLCAGADPKKIKQEYWGASSKE